MISSIHQVFATNNSSMAMDVVIYGSVTFAFLIFWKLLRVYRNRVVIPIYDESKGHHWTLIDIFSNVVYCNVCKGIIVDGMFCDLCGICADNNACHQEADTQIPCKPSSVACNGDINQHHWVQGNLSDHAVCSVCGEDMGEEDTLKDYRCSWCQRTVHEEERCFLKLKHSPCDLGEHRKYIIPPTSVKYHTKWVKGRKSKVVQSITASRPAPEWRPLIMIGNRKSGSNDGERILKAFRYILNAIQVIDTSESPPESVLHWCQLIAKAHPHTVPWILVAGGDGTVAWVLDAVDKLKLEPQPYVGIIPLGTGNDLAHVLGWDRFSPDLSISSMMEYLERCEVVSLDRWKVKISPPMFGLSFSKAYVMNNYLSIGVDALVALKFHQTRESRLYRWISSRLLNKMVYFGYGTKDVLERKCSQLNEKISLEIDGKTQKLPQLESILLLNIPSWGGGADIWSINRCSDPQIQKQSYNDKLVEVVGLYSSFHIAQMMIGLSEPYRFGQAKSVKIKLFDQLPMQIDGEPWIQHPCTIKIDWHRQAPMLYIDKDYPAD